MSDETFTIRFNHFSRESYIEEMVKFFSKKDNFCISSLDIKKKMNLEDFIIRKLLETYSNVEQYIYRSSDYLRRCAIVDQAIHLKAIDLESIIKDKFFAKGTEFKNVFEINKNLFEQFVSFFHDEIFIDWDSISRMEDLNWTLKILETGRFIWNWFEIQINPSLVGYFTDFELLKKYEHLLNWDIVSCDSRLEWTTTTIKSFKDRIKFSLIFDDRIKYDDRINFCQKCYANNGQPCGISMNPNLARTTIIENIKLWDMKYLSSNPAILIDNSFLVNNLSDIDLTGLSYNKGLNIEVLRFLKGLYNTIDKSSANPKLLYNGCEIHWCFHWDLAFENASVDWTIDNIEEFKSILSESSHNWGGISKNIKRKDVIIKYNHAIKFLLIALNNPTMVWDSELVGLLINSNISLMTDKNTKALPDVLKMINITNEAIIKYRNYWNNTYKYSFFIKTNDGLEKCISSFPLWKSLRENNAINWTPELLEYYNQSQNEI